jgi:hypothetical protein
LLRLPVTIFHGDGVRLIVLIIEMKLVFSVWCSKSFRGHGSVLVFLHVVCTREGVISYLYADYVVKVKFSKFRRELL